jgi:hypothetical protein
MDMALMMIIVLFFFVQSFAELRTVSNPVGPRDRTAWRVADALDALEAAIRPAASALAR